MSYVSISASIDVDADEVIEQLSAREVAELFKRHLPKQGLSVPMGSGDGDKRLDRYVEDAYRAAKSMPDCPPAIRDLFWHVHGRAI